MVRTEWSGYSFNTNFIQQDADYQKELLSYTKSETTIHGYAFWNRHPASEKLKEDLASGLVYKLKPSALRDTRPEYSEFPEKVFRKHVYQAMRAERERKVIGYTIGIKMAEHSKSKKNKS